MEEVSGAFGTSQLRSPFWTNHLLLYFPTAMVLRVFLFLFIVTRILRVTPGKLKGRTQLLSWRTEDLPPLNKCKTTKVN